MKSMKCDVCEATFQADDFSGWMEQMKGHYVEAHKDVMSSEDTGSMEQNMQKMLAWMNEMKAKWETVEEM
jgi:hypothetical protein